MIAELGHFSLILALGLATCLAVIPSLGVYRSRMAWMQLGGSLSLGVFVFVSLSFACLANAFINDDFSVAYVARNSNSALPIQYKVSAIWGAHEGSFLLWILVMSGWTLAVSLFSQGLSVDMRARVLAVLGTLNVGFMLFILLTSNPFDRSLPVFPLEGSDLNPLLQDFGLIVHPPMLYMGYVGFAVPFAFAIATLTSGRLDSAWARWSRPWTNVAWAFLTVGITLGSWWAYYELGWGGWWFWDAVENASFMPWLVGTALIHSRAATEKRGVFKSWTVLLALFAFSFSLLGAFLVRSGVLTSVHAFAVDPERGMFILIFLVLVIGSSLTLYAFKASGIKSDSGFEITSREALLLLNNMLLVVAASAVLLGTIYPLIYEAFTGGDKISVGPPYFNKVFVPVVMLLFVVMAVSTGSHWKKTSLDRLVKRHWIPLLGSVIAVSALLLLFASKFEPIVVFTNSVALWILVSLSTDWISKVQHKRDKLASLIKQPLSYYGMLLGHTGIAVAIIGVSITIYYSEEKDVRMEPGSVVTLAGYDFRLNSMSKITGPNYLADQGEIEVLKDDESIVTLYPQKRVYRATGSVMTEADMDPRIFRDLYVALGDPVGEDAWAVRIHYKPFVRWIWFGGLLIAVGGFVTVADRRYRKRVQRQAIVDTAGALA
ncbi:MAG TPA: heme lyase CcmF/NrfE family subunit [Pseudomonadales bacterium]|nr:heme lyase CcmF/NrfE family subunit [Pseudomonadales bacterium]